MEHFTFYKGAKIRYTDKGKGSVVVLLHGFLEDLSMWDFIVDIFAQKHRVFAIDLLGHGQSECIGYVHTMEEQADMVYHLLHENKIRKASFVGHSMGGYVALAFGELYPDAVKRLVLLNSTSRADSEARRLNRDRAISAVKDNLTVFIQLAISNLFSEKNKKNLNKSIKKTKQTALKTPLQGIIAALEGMKNRNDREVMLHFAPFPILLILGTDDAVLPYSEAVTQIEGTKVRLLSLDGGHMSHIENTDELILALVQFVK